MLTKRKYLLITAAVLAALAGIWTALRPRQPAIPPKPEDTALEFWITEDVKGVDWAAYEVYAQGFGVNTYFGTSYSNPYTDGRYPEHYVAYSVTAWPDYADGGQYITQIDITDPAVTLYGLTAGSSFEEFDAVFRGMGYALHTSDDGFTVTHTAAKNGVSFIFQAGRGGGPVLTVSAEINNRENICF